MIISVLRGHVVWRVNKNGLKRMTRRNKILLMTTVVFGLTMGMPHLHAETTPQNSPKDFIVPELKGSPEELQKLKKVMPPRPDVQDDVAFPRYPDPKSKAAQKQTSPKKKKVKKANKTTPTSQRTEKAPQRLRIDGGQRYSYQQPRHSSHHRVWRSQATSSSVYVFERKKRSEYSYREPKPVKHYGRTPYSAPTTKTCYMQVKTPATYRTITKQVLVSPARERRVVIPARYREVERRVMVKPERVKLVHHKARYDYVTERVLVKPERVHMRHHPAKMRHVQERVMVSPPQKRVHVTPPQYGYVNTRVQVAPARDYWQMQGYAGHCRTNPVYCRVQTPPQYVDQRRRVLVRPAQKHVQNIPARYQDVRRQVIVKPAYNERIVSPAVYRTVKRKVISSPAWQERIVSPAKYRIVREQVLVQAKRHEVHREPAVYKTVTKRVLVDEGKTHYQRVHVKKGGC